MVRMGQGRVQGAGEGAGGRGGWRGQGRNLLPTHSTP